MEAYGYETAQAFMMDIKHDKHVEIASLRQSGMNNQSIDATKKKVQTSEELDIRCF